MPPPPNWKATNDKNDDTKPIYSISFSIFGAQQYMRTTALAITCRGGVEDTRHEAKAKNTKKIRVQGQPFRGQNLSRPKTKMLEAKAKDRGHRRKRCPKKKVFKNIFQAISNSLLYPKFLIKEGLNHKSRDMMSSKFFQRGSFCGTTIS